jgi:hypothetical protein
MAKVKMTLGTISDTQVELVPGRVYEVGKDMTERFARYLLGISFAHPVGDDEKDEKPDPEEQTKKPAKGK